MVPEREIQEAPPGLYLGGLPVRHRRHKAAIFFWCFCTYLLWHKISFMRRNSLRISTPSHERHPNDWKKKKTQKVFWSPGSCSSCLPGSIFHPRIETVLCVFSKFSERRGKLRCYLFRYQCMLALIEFIQLPVAAGRFRTTKKKKKRRRQGYLRLIVCVGR